MAFDGVREAVMALGGRSQQRATGMERAVEHRSKQALLDERVARAALAAKKSNATTDLEGMLDPNDPLTKAIIAGLAGQMYSAERTRGEQTRNSVLDDVATRHLQGEDLETDNLNQAIAIMGNRLLTPNNVRVQDQAEADIGATKALETDRNRVTGTGTNRRNLTSLEIALVFGADEEGGRQYNDFVLWKAKNRKDHPEYSDESVALGDYKLWMESQGAGGTVQAAPVAGEVVPVEQSGEAPVLSDPARLKELPEKGMSKDNPITLEELKASKTPAKPGMWIVDPKDGIAKPVRKQ